MKCYGQGIFIAMYQIDDKFYRLNMFDHELEVGKMIFDSRSQEFKLLESEKDCQKMEFVDPELWACCKCVGEISAVRIPTNEELEKNSGYDG